MWSSRRVAPLVGVLVLAGFIMVIYIYTAAMDPRSRPVSAPEPRAVYFISCAFGVTGLGNLMFQYASLIGLARRNMMVPIVGQELPLHSIFKLPIKVSPEERPGIPWGKVIELKASSFDSLLGNLPFQHNIEVVGFLQSWMYFVHVQEEVIQHFQFHEHIRIRAENFLSNAIEEIGKSRAVASDLVFIGVHIRRGDYLSDRFSGRGYTVATSDYIERALAFYEQRFSEIIFVVSGNDRTWNEAVVKPNRGVAVFSSLEDDAADLALLASCNHTIMTVGTYSWWAATLAGGQVVYYKDFPRNDSELSRKAFSSHRKDYYPGHWIPL